MNVLNNIKSIMDDKGLSQRDLAVGLGKAESNVSHFLNGNRQLKTDDLYKIASVLEVSAIDILTYPDVYVRKNELLIVNEPRPEYGKINEPDNPWKLLYELQKKYGELEVENERLKNGNAVTPLAAKAG